MKFSPPLCTEGLVFAMISVMKTFTRILIIAGIVVLAGFAVWRMVNRTQVATAPGATESPSLSPTASISPVTIVYDAPGKDWKTYSSTSMGFSVSYPPDWKVGVCGPQCVGLSPLATASTQFVLGILESTGTMEDLLGKAQPYLVAKQTVTAGANTWQKLTLRQPDTGTGVTSHFIAHGAQLFEFGTATSDSAVLSVYGKAIASFKFLK